MVCTVQSLTRRRLDPILLCSDSASLFGKTANCGGLRKQRSSHTHRKRKMQLTHNTGQEDSLALSHTKIGADSSIAKPAQRRQSSEQASHIRAVCVCSLWSLGRLRTRTLRPLRSRPTLLARRRADYLAPDTHTHDILSSERPAWAQCRRMDRQMDLRVHLCAHTNKLASLAG